MHNYCQNCFDTKISKSLYCVAVFDVHYNKADFLSLIHIWAHSLSLTVSHTCTFYPPLLQIHKHILIHSHNLSLSLRHTHTSLSPSNTQTQPHTLTQSLSLLNTHARTHTHTLKSLSLAFVVNKCILKGLPRILSIAANNDKQFCFDENNDSVKLAYTIVW